MLTTFGVLKNQQEMNQICFCLFRQCVACFMSEDDNDCLGD